MKKKSGFNISEAKNKMSEINEKLNEKNKEADNLKNKYQDLYNKRMELERDDDLEDWVKQAAIDDYQEKNEEVKSEADALNNSMQEDLEKVESLKQEVSSEIESKETQQEKLNKRKEFVENLGFNKTEKIDKAIGDLRKQEGDLSEFLEDNLISTDKQIQSISNKLNNLNSRTWNEFVGNNNFIFIEKNNKIKIKKNVINKAKYQWSRFTYNPKVQKSLNNIKRAIIGVQIVNAFNTGHSINRLYNQAVQEYLNGNVFLSTELKSKADEKTLLFYFKLKDKYKKLQWRRCYMWDW